MDITHRGFEKATDKLTTEQLDRPVGEVVEAEKLEAEAPAESAPVNPIETESKAPETVNPEPEEEEKVPKSRFLTMARRTIEAERALRTFESERGQQTESVVPKGDDDTIRAHYVEMFGEGELTEKLYQAEMARLASIEDKAAERAYERLAGREKEEEALIEQRIQSFDNAFEELALLEGKTEFSENEQVAMLDIVEAYSPKDTDGKLIGEYLLPLDKAYEIYKLNNEISAQPKKQERNAVAALQGARSQGSPDNTSDSDWKPGWQGQWRDKLPK